MIVRTDGKVVDTDKCPDCDCTSCLKCACEMAWAFHRHERKIESDAVARAMAINND